MGRAMKLNIPTRDNVANVAVTLIKSGRPWMGYSLMMVCHAFTCLSIALAAVGCLYGLR